MQLEAEGTPDTRSPASTPRLGSPSGGVVVGLPDYDIEGALHGNDASRLRGSSNERRSQERMPYSDGDAFDQEKYPPRPTGTPGSTRIPLLSSNDSDDTLEEEGRRGTNHYAKPPSTFTRRIRLHPLTLVPAFLVGVLLARSGFFGATTIFKRPPEFKLNSYSIGPTNDDLLRLPTSSSNYTLHSSGHLFLHPSSLDYTSASSPLSPEQATEAPRGVRHPIKDLIENATREWEVKVARQSKTLEQAVAEYKRRNGFNPPKGFDHWFSFAQATNVVLIDEFDTILRDVRPFFALSPALIQSRSFKLQTDASTFTMVLKNREVEIIGPHAGDGRAEDQKGLMRRWAQWMDDVNITMSAHDGPSIMMDHLTRGRHQEAAKAGKILSLAKSNEVDEDAANWGFQLACPPESRIRRALDGLEVSALPAGPSYVYDHLKTMNICENPEWQYLHGFTSWPGMRPQVLRPLFSFSKTTVHSDILLTPLEQYWDKEPWDPVWELKKENKAVWRGSTTGVWFDRGTWWRSSQRMRLLFTSMDKLGSRLVRFDGVGKESGMGVESIVERRVATKDLVERYLNFGFSGKESQCTEKDGSCEAVKALVPFMKSLGWNEANEFKYFLDLDGNAWSGRFHRLLSSNSVVLKSTIFPEWYSGWIQPWVHYVPIKIDYSDLFDVMAFFSGDLEGRNGHEEEAKKIAAAGKEYTAKHWRYEDMEVYFFRLALEWIGPALSIASRWITRVLRSMRARPTQRKRDRTGITATSLQSSFIYPTIHPNRLEGF